MATAGSAALCSRLVDQLVLQQHRENELLQNSRRLAQLAAERQTLVDRENATAAEREKLTALRQRLLAKQTALHSTLKDDAAADERLRKELSDELTTRITEVNARMERECLEREEAHRTNAHLKEKIGLLKANFGAGHEKFVAIMASGESEGTGLEQKIVEERAIATMLTDRALQVDKDLSAATPLHTELKAKVAEFVARFSSVQKVLAGANAHFAQAKEAQEKASRRIAALEAERGESLRRLNRALQQLAVETEMAEKHQAHAALLEQQIAKFDSLGKMLQQQIEEATSKR
mgnify:FL=1